MDNLFKILKAGLTRPLPAWLTLILIFSLPAMAAIPLFTGSVSIATGGAMKDLNVASNTCVGINGASTDQYTYGTNCVDTAASQNIGGVKTFTSAPIISALTASTCVDTNASKALTSLAGDCAIVNANNNFSASQSVTGSLQATTFIAAGSATSACATNGDVCASRSTSSGAMNMGGSLSSCYFDYGVTTASAATLACPLSTIGNAIATNGGLNLMNDTSSGGQAAADVWMARDGAAVQGENFNVPTGSTNGWRFLTNAATVDFQITNAGSGLFRSTLEAANSAGATQTFVPPVYTSAGAVVTSSEHMVHFTQSITLNALCAANTTCTYASGTTTLSGAAAFTANPTCWASTDTGSGSQAIASTFNNSTTSINTSLYNNTASSIPNTTAFTIEVTCEGV